MPARVKCPNCDRVGFVRAETITKGTTSTVMLTCGICLHSWAQDDQRVSERYGD